MRKAKSGLLMPLTSVNEQTGAERLIIFAVQQSLA
jgi:hypothetical protein